MNYLKMLIIVAIAASCAARLEAGEARSKERMVVLGFASRQLNDVQDRLLRETVLRELYGRGYRIVPVMEIESLFAEGRGLRIRKLTRAELKSVCADLAAGFACNGTIAPEDGSRVDEIIAGKKYVCTLLVYRKDRDAFQNMTVSAVGGKSLYQFCSDMSKSIADAIGALP